MAQKHMHIVYKFIINIYHIFKQIKQLVCITV